MANEQKYFKITTENLNGKDYFGLFIGDSEDFECVIENFHRGWELDKYNQLDSVRRKEFEDGLRSETKNYIEIK